MTDDEAIAFGKELWERIREAFGGKNAAQIAIALGIQKQSVYKWGKGGLPSVETIIRIAGVTQSSLDWLLTGETTDAARDEAHRLEMQKLLLEMARQLAEVQAGMTDRIQDLAGKGRVEGSVKREEKERRKG